MRVSVVSGWYFRMSGIACKTKSAPFLSAFGPMKRILLLVYLCAAGWILNFFVSMPRWITFIFSGVRLQVFWITLLTKLEFGMIFVHCRSAFL